MRAVVLACVAVSVLAAGCDRGPEEFATVADIAAALEDEGIDCPSVESEPSGDLVAEQGTCGGHDLYVFDDEKDRDRWLSVGAGLGNVVVGPNWAIVPGDAARDIADALGGDVR
jgi:hypothetical protein